MGLDAFIALNNNTLMSIARLAPVVVLINLAGSSGATG